MELDEVARLVSDWASSKSQILKVQFFGSRVKQTHRPDSDLDVAITLFPDLDESGGVATWFRYCKVWAEELNSIVPLEVQIELEAGKETPTISKGLDEASVLVYQRKL